MVSNPPRKLETEKLLTILRQTCVLRRSLEFLGFNFLSLDIKLYRGYKGYNSIFDILEKRHETEILTTLMNLICFCNGHYGYNNYFPAVIIQE